MIYISAFGMVNALGSSLSEISQNLTLGLSPGIKERHDWLQNDQSAVLGGVDGELPSIPPEFAAHNSRNNRLLLAALDQIQVPVQQAIAQYGSERVAIIMGTSTSGLDEGDRYVDTTLNQPAQSSHWQYPMQELGDPSRFLSLWLKLHGPAYTISTACSSSARAIIAGCRLIEAGIVDAALVGGADTLSRMPINGFNSLESLSLTLCQPFGQERAGITIGEAAGLMLLTKEPQPLAVLGFGESSDAHHISAPHPQGVGATQAILQALSQAQLTPSDIGYINLHGTATPLNDQVESKVIADIFGQDTPCSSTKHLTGHTLGAAGITEAVLSALILQENLALPAQDFSRYHLDPSLPACGLLSNPQPLRKAAILSNSFAFGGNNACIILGNVS